MPSGICRMATRASHQHLLHHPLLSAVQLEVYQHRGTTRAQNISRARGWQSLAFRFSGIGEGLTQHFGPKPFCRRRCHRRCSSGRMGAGPRSSLNSCRKHRHIGKDSNINSPQWCENPTCIKWMHSTPGTCFSTIMLTAGKHALGIQA